MRLSTCILAAGIALTAIPAIAHDFRAGDIAIGHPWTRATPPGAKVGGGYLTLSNEGDATDQILGGTSAAAGRVEIHLMEMTDGIMKMRPVIGGVEIAPGQTVEFAPGGYHLMLMELAQPIADGARIPLTLEFQKAGKVEIELAAGPLGGPAPGRGTEAGGVSGHGGHD